MVPLSMMRPPPKVDEAVDSMSRVFAWTPPAKVEVPLPFTSMRPVVVALPVTVKSPMRVEELCVMKPELSVARPEKMAVDEAESAPCMFKLEAIVDEADAINPPSKIERPETDSVLDADNAPVAPITKSGALVESTNRRMSPLCARVVEAKMRVPVVLVAKRVKRAFRFRLAAVVVVPMKIESAVVVGAR